MLERIHAVPVDMPADVERVADADRAFFRRFPARRHRIRLLAASEMQLGADHGHRLPTLPDGWRWFCAVRREAADAWTMLTLAAPGGCETDVPEALAASLYGLTEALGPTGLMQLHVARAEMEADRG